jgi:hypothetical protein
MAFLQQTTRITPHKMCYGCGYEWPSCKCADGPTPFLDHHYKECWMHKVPFVQGWCKLCEDKYARELYKKILPGPQTQQETQPALPCM